MRRLALAILALFAATAVQAEQYWKYPPNALPMVVSSSNTPNGAISVTLQAATGWLTYMQGIYCQYGGATAAGEVNLTIASLRGVDGNATTLNVPVIVPAGASIMGSPLLLSFDPPLPANGPGQAITALLPALGAGNLYAGCTLTGFRVPAT